MAEALDKYKILVKRLHLFLKEQGFPFKKDGFTLRWIDESASPKIAKIVNFQRSAFSTRNCISFTINLGVLIEYGEKPISQKLKESECPIRKRPASFTGKYPYDKWWDVTETTDIEQLYSELCDLTVESIIPFFELYQNSR